MSHTNRRIARRLYRLGWLDTPDPAKVPAAAERIRATLAEVAAILHRRWDAVAAGFAEIARVLGPIAQQHAN